jgi:phage FluMu protein Com
MIKIICPRCGRLLKCDDARPGKKFKCPRCKHLILVSDISTVRAASTNRRRAKRKFLAAACIAVLLAAIAVARVWIVPPVSIHWTDRRPIGVLFLASNFHSSEINPRGWFNEPGLDVTGPDGPERFRKALLDYTDRSIAILKRTGAQGVIVWDLEGEQYPHKTTYIGDPRLLDSLAPEMAPVVNEFFRRLRDAGLKIGLTVRPQELDSDNHGHLRQMQVFDTRRTLLEKIDYARARWGATMFYVDSNGGIRRPDEAWQLRRVAEQRPDILLIPEHHYLPYSAFSAPYVPLRKGDPVEAAGLARKLFPGSFRVLDISDASSDTIAAARQQGDILLFRAWYWNSDCDLLEKFAHDQQQAQP